MNSIAISPPRAKRGAALLAASYRLDATGVSPALGHSLRDNRRPRREFFLRVGEKYAAGGFDSALSRKTTTKADYQTMHDDEQKLGDVDRVRGGDLDPVIKAYLVFRKTGRIAGDGRDDLPD